MKKYFNKRNELIIKIIREFNMANVTHNLATNEHSLQPMGKQTFALTSLTTLFFMWGFITCLNDILIPYLKGMFSLNYTQAMLIQFCFFGAYFVMSIPAGKLVSKIGYQFGIVVGLVVAAQMLPPPC